MASYYVDSNNLAFYKSDVAKHIKELVAKNMIKELKPGMKIDPQSSRGFFFNESTKLFKYPKTIEIYKIYDNFIVFTITYTNDYTYEDYTYKECLNVNSLACGDSYFKVLED